ncbi:uncharacterized protein F4807DRAFT_408819 [Annulohypoxylon truncatum]|uniref:uncharacterized protein n=1 Tax=Annulohypoxylon truncatum TaxID=327061 RepID=UPI0020073161|nr:uncharacterized protein F4807DRAFT_408819 [Annulohypoxylon truncatum]KAI1213718.1 hypothetical protein F4807DRAFT_408819 [Annulohypoxylon truncatum]
MNRSTIMSIMTIWTTAILFVLLLQIDSALARPLYAATSTTTYPLRPTSLVNTAGWPTRISQNNDASEILAIKTYPLTITGTALTALSLCLSIITTLIAIIDLRLKIKDRTELRRQRIIGAPRNPINDEASREARDALALPHQIENTSDRHELELAVLPTTPKVDKVSTPLPMPAERPSSICRAEPQSYDHGAERPRLRRLKSREDLRSIM